MTGWLSNIGSSKANQSLQDVQAFFLIDPAEKKLGGEGRRKRRNEKKVEGGSERENDNKIIKKKENAWMAKTDWIRAWLGLSKAGWFYYEKLGGAEREREV